jgi:CRISPR-associated protein Cas1
MHLIIDQFGSFVGKKSGRLRVTNKGEVVHEVPFFKLRNLLITARGVSLSSDVIHDCTQAGIPINFVSYTAKPYARIISSDLAGTVKTRREQLLAYTDSRGVVLGKAFAAGKLGNQSNLLKYMAKYRKDRQRETLQLVRDAAIEIQVMKDELQGLQGQCIDAVRLQLMNLEGRAAKMYWDAIGKLLLGDLEWKGREHRGATDPVNSALNYGYGVLYTQIEGAIVLAGLDPYAGFVHVDRPGKPSLVLDLIEEFRQMVVDRVVFGLLNKGVEIAVDERGLLTEVTRRVLAEKVLERPEGHERYEAKKHALRAIIQSQARHVATFLQGERENYKPFIGSW